MEHTPLHTTIAAVSQGAGGIEGVAHGDAPADLGEVVGFELGEGLVSEIPRIWHQRT